MRRLPYTLALAVAVASTVTIAVSAKVTDHRGDTCFASDSLPDHPTGNLPNSGNPNNTSAFA